MNDTELANDLLRRAGTTYAEQSKIKLVDKPAPLYRLLVLSVLLSTRIKSDIAVAAARELGEFGTAKRMAEASWQQRVDALGRGHYVRYDESTSTALGEGANLLLDKYHGDLRVLRGRANGDVDTLRELLRKVPKLGPVGVDIFCREAQAVWPELAPYFDKKALSGAKKVGLPATASELAALVPDDQIAALAAALVRVTLEKNVAKEFVS